MMFMGRSRVQGIEVSGFRKKRVQAKVFWRKRVQGSGIEVCDN